MGYPSFILNIEIIKIIDYILKIIYNYVVLKKSI